MNYKDLQIKVSYRSYGSDNIADSFLTPVLKCTKLYKRSVGFFSSSVLESIMDGVIGLARSRGNIRLVASPQLSEDDKRAIESGYAKREIVQGAVDKAFKNSIEEFDDNKLKLLSELIAMGILDIKIAVTEDLGIYHDKLGILEDFDGNKIVFYGSPNSSASAYKYNYEKIRVITSWDKGSIESIKDEEDEFDALWNGTNPYLTVYDYKESAQKNIIKILDYRKDIKTKQSAIKLRDYQEAAIKAWVDNGYHGFYVMATGTGKTWTAIFSAKELLKKKHAMVVICAPYKHLIRQWVSDLEVAFPSAEIIMVSSENGNWTQQLREEVLRQKYNKESEKQLIVVSTIASFNLERFGAIIDDIETEKMLIVDEAHRFTKRTKKIQECYQYMLGLSATPFSGRDAGTGNELMSFFGGQVFSLPIEDALSRGFLVPYSYHPVFVHATEDEEQQFNYYSQRMMYCMKNGVIIDQEGFSKAHRGRLRVISMCEEKNRELAEIVKTINSKDHFIVYCGDGRLFDESGEEVRHINAVKSILSDLDYKCSQFTAQENMDKRMQLIDAFNKGEISTLVAIRCLDEGINIPSIQSALILSSNDNYREFVQRRGRILRTYPEKESAQIYDVIVLPSHGAQSWATIEFRRYYEYAHLATNYELLKQELEWYIDEYQLNEDEVKAFNYETVEDELDE